MNKNASNVLFCIILALSFLCMAGCPNAGEHDEAVSIVRQLEGELCSMEIPENQIKVAIFWSGMEIYVYGISDKTNQDEIVRRLKDIAKTTTSKHVGVRFYKNLVNPHKNDEEDILLRKERIQ